VSGWNEIDAVGLQGADGCVQWAKHVRASSTYASAVAAGSVRTIASLLPRWADVAEPSEAFRDEQVQSEHRVLDGRGWPAVALVADVTGREASGALPFRPVLPGFALDAVLLAMASALLWWLLIWPRKFVVESMRLRRGQCMRCGYELQYDFAAGCPECGWRRQ
jgi:hypothetical protein